MPESADQPKDIPHDALCVSQYPQVIFEEEDHEVVVVNLLEGTYYYLTGTAAFVWMGLHAGMTLDPIAQGIQGATGHHESVSDDLVAFISQLIGLGLVSIVSELPVEALPHPDAGDYLGEAYASPVIETYSDLQDILLLDPVHDVDESGWPTPRQP